MTAELSLAKRIELVKAAIERIRAARAQWNDKETDPSSTGDERWEAKRRFEACEAEFSWQWKNVEVILQEHGL